MAAQLTLVGNVPAWRPETGHMLYGPKPDLLSSMGSQTPSVVGHPDGGGTDGIDPSLPLARSPVPVWAHRAAWAWMRRPSSRPTLSTRRCWSPGLSTWTVAASSMWSGPHRARRCRLADRPPGAVAGGYCYRHLGSLRRLPPGPGRGVAPGGAGRGPLHAVRLANAALDDVRRRVQQHTLGHRVAKVSRCTPSAAASSSSPRSGLWGVDQGPRCSDG
jgi:hypothetical protein